MWLAMPTSGPDQNRLTYQLQIQPLVDEGEEPGEEDYHTLEHTFNISNMKVREKGERGRIFRYPTVSISTVVMIALVNVDFPSPSLPPPLSLSPFLTLSLTHSHPNPT